NIRDGLDSPVGMPREPSQIVGGDIIPKIVEKEKRIEVRRIAESKRAAQVHPRAFERWLGLDQPLDRSNGHIGLHLRVYLGSLQFARLLQLRNIPPLAQRLAQKRACINPAAENVYTAPLVQQQHRPRVITATYALYQM